jgi:hypothetical protein
MVLRLCEVLEVPLRHRNGMLLAAGFSPGYSESRIDDPALEPILKAVGVILEKHNPYPAIMVDRHWEMQLQNVASMVLAGLFADQPTRPEFNNVVRLLFHQRGLRPWVVNWHEVGATMIQRLHREAASDGHDPASQQLLDEVLSHDSIPGDWRFANLDNDLAVVMPIHLKKGDIEMRLHTALTTLGTALDVTLNELRIETFLPADEATDRTLLDCYQRFKESVD